MSQARHLMHDIDTMVTARPPAECGRLFQRLANLYEDFARRSDEGQLAVFDDVFLRLLPGCDHETLLSVIRHWARADHAPRRTLIRLALHPAQEFCIPVLVHAKQFDADDLLHIAEQASETQLLFLATRAGLPAIVSDYLLVNGSLQVRDVLVANQSAQFSKNGCVLRDAMRGHKAISGAAPSMASLVLQAKLGMVALSATLTEHRNSDNGIEPLILSLVEQSQWADRLAVLALETDLSAGAMVRALLGPDITSLMQVGRALGWSWSLIETLLQVRTRLDAPAVSASDVRQAYQAFDRDQARQAHDFLVRRSRQTRD
jgi:hypothetical protein